MSTIVSCKQKLCVRFYKVIIKPKVEECLTQFHKFMWFRSGKLKIKVSVKLCNGIMVFHSQYYHFCEYIVCVHMTRKDLHIGI